MTQATDTTILYGTTWCGDCARSKAFLDSLDYKYDFVNIEEDEQAAAKVVELNNGNRSIPTLVFPDGSVLTEPSDEQLKAKVAELQQR